jgi:nitrile hydratase subunit alpha
VDQHVLPANQIIATSAGECDGLAEFGVYLPESTRIRVWDSTAEVRYLVIPMRPEGTDGMSEEALADLVTRDSMIGTGLALKPGVVR